MSEDREPFFTPGELKGTVLLRPTAWREWWTTEPLTTKLVAFVLSGLAVYGVFAVLRGDGQLGWPLVAVLGIPLSFAFFISFANVSVAGLRWVLRRIGVAAVWRKVREGLVAVWLKVRKVVLPVGRAVLATAQAAVWIGAAVWIVAAQWAYLSLDPIKSWYALLNRVPVDRVEIQKKPHDCEFETSPLGSKHCHYDAKPFVLQGADTSDGQRSLLVSYEKVED